MTTPYNILYLDPPWRYNSRANHKTRFRGGACGHYPLMGMTEIAALPIGQLAARDCALLMWCTFHPVRKPKMLDTRGIIEVLRLTQARHIDAARNLLYYNAARFVGLCESKQPHSATERAFCVSNEGDMTAVGKTGKEWRKVDPNEVKEWRRLALEERKSFRAIGRMYGREHSIIRRHVKDAPEDGPIIERKPPKKRGSQPKTAQSVMINVLTMARGRSKKLGREFNLTLPIVMDMYERQNGKCLLTGISFSLERSKMGRTSPFRPSIDRIDSSKGYTSDNVRLVLWGINAAMHEWGEDVYAQIAAAYVEKQQGKHR